MCGVVAIDIQNVTEGQIEHLTRVLTETEIRGKHASGVSWFANGEVHTVKRSIPMSEFVKEFSIRDCVFEGNLKMIAHIRYSTSNLEFNQPIEDGTKGFAIAHNGIISQSEPIHWSDEFGLGNPSGSNDSELIFMSHANGKHPLSYFPEASMSVATINSDGIVTAYRNGKRPMWVTSLPNGYISTSTSDIVRRSGLKWGASAKSTPGVEYNLTNNTSTTIVPQMEDLQ